MNTKLPRWFIGLSRRKKALILIGVDFFFAVFALWSAFSVRLGELFVPEDIEWYFFGAAPFLAVPIFIRLGLYRAIIRYIEVRALWTIVQAVSIYAFAFACIFFAPFVIYETGIKNLPRTVPLLNWLIMMLLVGSSRFFARWWLGDIYLAAVGGRSMSTQKRKRNVLIYGAGGGGVQLASALAHGHEYRPVAFIDDDKSLHRHKINGLRIYPFSSLSYLIERHQVSDVLLAMPSASRARKGELIRLLEPYAVHVMSMPSLADIAQGKVTFDTLQEVDIGDLLGRDPVAPDQSLLHANISGKVVMVTGAGGSIGAELCRQILKLQPASLVLFELSECALYQIEKELTRLLAKSQSAAKPEIFCILGSVTKPERMQKICKTFKVQTIYHAAAYKHVPMVEKNPGEAVSNNIFGTYHAAQAAILA
ncbi:MAG: polysaccharide biosynthesis protein, partial [Gammaproteobacteria bacterium]